MPAAKGEKEERKTADRIGAVAVRGRSNLNAGRNGQRGSDRGFREGPAPFSGRPIAGHSVVFIKKTIRAGPAVRDAADCYDAG